MDQATISARSQLLARPWDFPFPGVPAFYANPEDVEAALRALSESEETYMTFWVRGVWAGPDGPIPGEIHIVVERFPRRGYAEIWLEYLEPDFGLGEE